MFRKYFILLVLPFIPFLQLESQAQAQAQAQAKSGYAVKMIPNGDDVIKNSNGAVFYNDGDIIYTNTTVSDDRKSCQDSLYIAKAEKPHQKRTKLVTSKVSCFLSGLRASFLPSGNIVFVKSYLIDDTHSAFLISEITRTGKVLFEYKTDVFENKSIQALPLLMAKDGSLSFQILQGIQSNSAPQSTVIYYYKDKSVKTSSYTQPYFLMNIKENGEILLNATDHSKIIDVNKNEEVMNFNFIVYGYNSSYEAFGLTAEGYNNIIVSRQGTFIFKNCHLPKKEKRRNVQLNGVDDEGNFYALAYRDKGSKYITLKLTYKPSKRTNRNFCTNK